MEPEGALNLSTQQHAGQHLKEKQEDMQESFTGKAGHTHTIYIPASLQAFLFPGNFFQQHFLPSTVAWSELCHFTTFSLLFETTKHLSIFLFSSRIERPVVHIQSVGLEWKFPNTKRRDAEVRVIPFLRVDVFSCLPRERHVTTSLSTCLSKCCH